MTERLQKFLASAGVASRRKAEVLIAEGRVRVNSAVVREPGTKVDPSKDLVAVDGKLVSAREEERYVLLYKPPGCVTTLSDPEGRPTAADYLRELTGPGEGRRGERLFPVGRLDYDAEGAVLFTTDGDLAHKLAHPRFGHERVYLAKVKGEATAEQLAAMLAGVKLEDGSARALQAAVHEKAERNTWLRLVVGEGRYHLVKRLCEAVGLQVVRLFRPEFGGISVAGLRPGKWRELDPSEVAILRRAVGEGGKAVRTPARELPKAARRHGHGPPAARLPREAALPAEPAQEVTERSSRGSFAGERVPRGPSAGGNAARGPSAGWNAARGPSAGRNAARKPSARPERSAAKSKDEQRPRRSPRGPRRR